jgi:protein gp37
VSVAKTKIEWTDSTWSPVTGCTKVSPGCKHCYAETVAERFWAKQYSEVGPSGRSLDEYPVHQEEELVMDGLSRRRRFTDVWMHPDRLDEPLRWRKPRRVFVNSMSDLFHEDVPDGFVMRVLNVMAQTPHHTYQILTKRPGRMRSFFSRWADLTGEDFDPKLVCGPEETRKAHPSPRGQLFASMLESMGEPPAGCAYPTFDWLDGMIRWPATFEHIWLGVSVENQETADERIPLLLQTPAIIRFVSCEPLLGPIDLSRWL